MKNKQLGLTVAFLTVFFSLLDGQIVSQNIRGNWIKYEARRLDGSRVIDRLGTDYGYLEYEIGKREICILNEPLGSKTCANYRFRDEMLYIGYGGEFKVERLANDTLIISEWDLTLPDDKLNRICFVERDHLMDNLIMTGDTVLAEEFSSPKFDIDFNAYLYNEIKGDFEIVKFKGYLVIDRINKKVFTEITEAPISNEKTLEAIISAINQSYDKWSFTKYNKHDLIKIPFVGKTQEVEFLKGVKVHFYRDSYEYLDRRGTTRLEDITLSSRHFQLGIEDVGNNNFDSAIENFSKSYELNPMLIDAIYNRAAVFQEIGNVEDACTDWKHLADLGQKRAETFWTEFCD